MVLVEIVCAGCGCLTKKPKGEVTRSIRLGRRMFCSRSCSAKAGNVSRKSKQIKMTCPGPGCGKTFDTTTHNKARRHCSPSCASKASMSKSRRKAQRTGGIMQIDNLLTTAETLKLREAWKYVAIKEMLAKSGREFEFEFELADRVYDLALLDTKVLVEFDGPYREWSEQQEDDKDKEKIAEEAGFTVIRRQTLPATVISPLTLEGL